MIKFHEPYKSRNTNKYLDDVTIVNNFSNNKYNTLCLDLLKSKFGFTNIHLTNSATASLEIMGMILKNENNKNTTLLPSYTFSSTANGFLRSQQKIKFIDIDVNNGMIDLSDKIFYESNTENNLCIVHYAGSSIEFDNLPSMSRNKIFEDAAQGLGTRYKKNQIGTFGRFGCISFHPTKSIHSGFGGLINFKYKKDFEKAKEILERGTDRTKVISGLKNKYEWPTLGSSFELPEINAAILYSQLQKFDEIIEIRKEIYDIYFEKLNDPSLGISTQKFNPRKIDHNFHSFYIVLENFNRDIFISKMNNMGVQCYIGYVPLHTSIYGKKNFKTGKLKNTDKFGSKLVRLPIHTNMRKEDANNVVKCINKVLKDND